MERNKEEGKGRGRKSSKEDCRVEGVTYSPSPIATVVSIIPQWNHLRTRCHLRCPSTKSSFHLTFSSCPPGNVEALDPALQALQGLFLRLPCQEVADFILAQDRRERRDGVIQGCLFHMLMQGNAQPEEFQSAR